MDVSGYQVHYKDVNLCRHLPWFSVREVQVVHHGDVGLLRAVQVDIPAELGQEKQFTRLKICNILKSAIVNQYPRIIA